MAMPARTRVILFHGAAVVGLSLLQATLPDDIAGMGGKPDFTLVLTILTGFLFGPFEGGVVGLAAGFLRDAFGGGTIGAGMLLGMYCGVLSALLFRRTFHRSAIAGFLQVAIVTTLSMTLVEVLGLFFSPNGEAPFPPGWIGSFASDRLLPSVLLNLAATAPLLLVLRFAGPRARSADGIRNEGAYQEGWNRP